MKKWIFACILLFSLGAAAFAQTGDDQNDESQQPQSLKDMAVSQLFQYGESLYDRGNYTEAAKVFSHIVDLDPGNKPAQEYLQKLNDYKPAEQSQDNQTPVQSNASVASGPNADLKQEMASEDQAIGLLHEDLDHLQGQQTVNGADNE